MTQLSIDKAIPVTPDLSGRTFCLLQGPSSRFFAHLGRALRSRGAEVVRIGFCPGDRLFWSATSGRYLPFRESISDFERWIAETLKTEQVTDLIMLGDGRKPHEIAIDAAKTAELRVKTWIIEHGYLRPDLILIEPDGMGGGSTIPRGFKSSDMGDSIQPRSIWPASFLRYAAMDVSYHFTNVALAWLFYPAYRAHSGIHPIREYAGWIKKLATASSRRAEATRTMARLLEREGSLFLLPLQLSHDAQLLKYGPGPSQPEIVEQVVASFQRFADQTATLIVKVHPMDNALMDWRVYTKGTDGRVVFLDGGDLDTLLGKVSGVVTVNSTVGLTSLRAGVPTLALGQAIYKSAGLTDSQPIDTFWTNPSAPDLERVHAFCDHLISHHHVRGAFDGPGAPAGAAALADWLAQMPIKRPSAAA